MENVRRRNKFSMVIYFFSSFVCFSNQLVV
nr:MAG TPA: hypothetical protein [Ackermannviridae sp.]